jgi:hypothetical protein
MDAENASETLLIAILQSNITQKNVILDLFLYPEDGSW